MSEFTDINDNNNNEPSRTLFKENDEILKLIRQRNDVIIEMTNTTKATWQWCFTGPLVHRHKTTKIAKRAWRNWKKFNKSIII